VADARGDYPVAHAHLEESLVIWHEFGDPYAIAYSLHKLGRVAQHQGQWTAAAAYFSQSLAISQQQENKLGIAECLEGLAAVASGQGHPERAARLFGAAAALREARSLPIPPVERADLDRGIAAVRSNLGEEAFAAAWARGQAMPLEHAITEALLVADPLES
jgi:tetratricopeptide (TPR) repeat protein